MNRTLTASALVALAALMAAPAFAAAAMLDVIDRLTPGDSGGLFAWDGNAIPF